MSAATQEIRPVRIYIAMPVGPLMGAIKQVLSVTGSAATQTFVNTTAEADLIIFNSIHEIENDFDKQKRYALVGMRPESAHMPQNCTLVQVGTELVSLLKIIGEVRDSLTSKQEVVVPPAVVEEVVPLRADALRILVIDDLPNNIASAKKGLAGHHLTTVAGYEAAMGDLAKNKYDVVLTDLHLPMSSKTLGSQAFKLGELVPYGILLMIEAARQGAKYVAVVTDLNHHADPFSAAFDHFSRFPFKIDGAKVMMMHAPMSGDAKNWSEALYLLLKD